MVEPGTAAIATLATIAGVSGYGAMKVNKNQDVVIEQKVQERIAQTEERLKSTQEALKTMESIKAKQDAELIAIQKELEILRKAKDCVEKKPASSLFKGVFRKKTPDPIPAPIPDTAPGPVFPESVRIREATPVVIPEPVPVPAPVVPEPVPEPAPAVAPVVPEPEIAPIVPEPVPAPFVPEPEIAPIVPEPVPAPVVPEPEERTTFGPQTTRDRLRAAKEKAAQMKRGTISNNVMTRLEEDLQTDATIFPDMPALAATTARPSERVPPQPPVRATRRNSNKVRAPPPPPWKGGMRKKKLRTRRGGKQKHV
jgi:hypothetical protein